MSIFFHKRPCQGISQLINVGVKFNMCKISFLSHYTNPTKKRNLKCLVYISIYKQKPKEKRRHTKLYLVSAYMANVINSPKTIRFKAAHYHCRNLCCKK